MGLISSQTTRCPPALYSAAGLVILCFKARLVAAAINTCKLHVDERRPETKQQSMVTLIISWQANSLVILIFPQGSKYARRTFAMFPVAKASGFIRWTQPCRVKRQPPWWYYCYLNLLFVSDEHASGIISPAAPLYEGKP